MAILHFSLKAGFKFFPATLGEEKIQTSIPSITETVFQQKHRRPTFTNVFY